MNSANYVEKRINDKLVIGLPLSDIAWEAALDCVGWAYVFGAWGEACTPKNREKFFKSQGAEHPTIKKACQAINNGKTCDGCKWYYHTLSRHRGPYRAAVGRYRVQDIREGRYADRHRYHHIFR